MTSAQRTSERVITALFIMVSVIVTLAITVFCYVVISYRHAISRVQNNSASIHDLACVFVQGVPDSADPRVAGFRAKYGCPPYEKFPAKNLDDTRKNP